ncbi:unnamed protein product [Ascophyllum nodosum]
MEARDHHGRRRQRRVPNVRKQPNQLVRGGREAVPAANAHLGLLGRRPAKRSEALTREARLFLVKGVSPTTFEIWGMVPADQCTSNMFWGCSRSSDAGRRIPINPIMSAKVMTAGTFSFRYGRVEVKAKLPKGDWLFPAIWLLPEHNAYGQWPASGEIDVMESRGNAPPYAKGIPDIGGVESYSSAAHWGPHVSMNSWNMTFGATRLDKGTTFNDDFHVFGLYWDETQMYTYLDTDDNRVLSVDFGVGTDSEGMWEKGHFAERYPGVQNPWKGGAASAPFDQRFYLAINVAVGGLTTYFPDGVGGKMWGIGDSDAAMKFLEAAPQWFDTWDGKGSTLQVEHVRVWQTNPDYFFSPAAASSTAAAPAAPPRPGGGGGAGPYANAEKPMPEDWSADMAVAGGEASPSGSSWHLLGYLSCALVGALVGGFAVGAILQRQHNYR